MGARKRDLDVAKDDLLPLEWLDVAACLALGSYDNFVRKPDLALHLESEQSIWCDCGTWNQGLASPSSQSSIGEGRDWVEAVPVRPGIVHFHRSNKKHLLLRSTTYLVSRPFTTQVGVINAHVAQQRLGGFALTLGFYQLVVQQPGRLPGNANLASQGQSGDLCLGLGHSGRWPETTWSAPTGCGASGCPRSGMFAAGSCSIASTPGCSVETRHVIAPAFRAALARWPNCLEQCHHALRFRAV